MVDAGATKANDSETYLVYGRKAYEEPLQYVAMVSGTELERSAGEKDVWVELIAFPKAAVIQVIPQAEDDE